MEHFKVELDSPSNQQFLPGQQISGKVHLLLKEPIKARSITVQIAGKAKTAWVSHESGNASTRIALTLVKSLSSHLHHVHLLIPYKAKVAYIDENKTLWQTIQKDSLELPIGAHSFPFTFQLPYDCPPSFEASKGVSAKKGRAYIRYSCKAKIERIGKKDDQTEIVFAVMPQSDLNSIQQAALPMVRDISKNVGVLPFKQGKVHARVFLQKSGYVPGEQICIRIEITNESSTDVVKVKCKLIQVGHYTANQALFGKTKMMKRDVARTMTKMGVDCRIGANTNGDWSGEIAVPELVPSFNSQLIQVDYQMQVKLVTNGSFGNIVEGDVPLLIGTIPSCRTQQQHPPQFGTAPGEDPFPTAQEPTAPSMNDAYGPPPSYKDSISDCKTLQPANPENDE